MLYKSKIPIVIIDNNLPKVKKIGSLFKYENNKIISVDNFELYDADDSYKDISILDDNLFEKIDNNLSLYNDFDEKKLDWILKIKLKCKESQLIEIDNRVRNLIENILEENE